MKHLASQNVSVPSIDTTSETHTNEEQLKTIKGPSNDTSQYSISTPMPKLHILLQSTRIEYFLSQSSPPVMNAVESYLRHSQRVKCTPERLDL